MNGGGQAGCICAQTLVVVHVFEKADGFTSHSHRFQPDDSWPIDLPALDKSSPLVCRGAKVSKSFFTPDPGR
jgi:hypothetical protein